MGLQRIGNGCTNGTLAVGAGHVNVVIEAQVWTDKHIQDAPSPAEVGFVGGGTLPLEHRELLKQPRGGLGVRHSSSNRMVTNPDRTGRARFSVHVVVLAARRAISMSSLSAVFEPAPS